MQNNETILINGTSFTNNEIQKIQKWISDPFHVDKVNCQYLTELKPELKKVDFQIQKSFLTKIKNVS